MTRTRIDFSDLSFLIFAFFIFAVVQICAFVQINDERIFFREICGESCGGWDMLC